MDRNVAPCSRPTPWMQESVSMHKSPTPLRHSRMNQAREEEEEEKERKRDRGQEGFPGGCLLVAKAGTLGEFPSDAAKDHQGPGGPYSGQTQEWPIDIPPGTTECPRCSRPGDLPKQRVGESTLGAHLVWDGPPPVLVGVGTEGGPNRGRRWVAKKKERPGGWWKERQNKNTSEELKQGLPRHSSGKTRPTWAQIG